MTRFEQIAAAFPLHAQRIAEATYRHSDMSFAWLFDVSDGRPVASVLAGLFSWVDTDEGHDYWVALYWGAQ